MKRLLFILFLFSKCFAQPATPTGYNFINSKYDWLEGKFRTLHIPSGGATQTLYGGWIGAGALYWDSVGKKLSIWDGAAWQSAGGGVTSIATTDPITGGTITTTGTISLRQSWIDSIRANSFADHGIILTIPDTLTSTTNPQAVFNINTGNGSGAILLSASSLYEFECFFTMTAMSATAGNTGFQILGSGTASISSASWSSYGRDATTANNPQAESGMFSAAQSNTGDIVAASTGPYMQVLIKGTFTTGNSGTIIPSVTLTTAAAAIVGVGSYFKYKKLGASGATSW